MNELQTVLSDAIQKLTRHRHQISDRIAALERENVKVASKFHDQLKLPEVQLGVRD